MKPILISYRRDDSAAEAILLKKYLEEELDKDLIFMDTQSIEAGSIWPDELENAIKAAKVVIIVIGKKWLKIADEDGRRRIDNPNDWVRKEIEKAKKVNAVMIPVLVDGATLPREKALPEAISFLSKRMYIPIRRDYWEHDISLLLKQIENQVLFKSPKHHAKIDIYPKNTPTAATPLRKKSLEEALRLEIPEWKINKKLKKQEVVREYTFNNFQDVTKFMFTVSPACDVLNHHPNWQNIWKTLIIRLNTWDDDLFQITNRDIILAKYFDRIFNDFYLDKK